MGIIGGTLRLPLPFGRTILVSNQITNEDGDVKYTPEIIKGPIFSSKPFRAICKVTTNHGQGTGFLLKIWDKEMKVPIYGLMTCHHICPQFMFKQRNISFEFQSIKLITKSSMLFDERDQSIFYDTDLDVTFFYLSENSLLLKTEGLVFLEPEEIDERMDIAVFQHTWLDEVTLSVGNIAGTISDKTAYIKHTACTLQGSSGAPIVCATGKVVAMHAGAGERENIGIKMGYMELAILKHFKGIFYKTRAGFGELSFQGI